MSLANFSHVCYIGGDLCCRMKIRNIRSVPCLLNKISAVVHMLADLVEQDSRSEGKFASNTHNVALLFNFCSLTAFEDSWRVTAAHRCQHIFGKEARRGSLTLGNNIPLLFKTCTFNGQVMQEGTLRESWLAWSYLRLFTPISIFNF